MNEVLNEGVFMRIFILLLALAWVGAGCVQLDGGEPNGAQINPANLRLRFRPIPSPVMVGGMFVVETLGDFRVDNVEVSDATIFRVDNVDGVYITLEALAAGETQFDVLATHASGEVREASFTLNAEHATQFQLQPVCSALDAASIFTGLEDDLPRTLLTSKTHHFDILVENDEGRRLRGAHAALFGVEPAGALTLGTMSFYGLDVTIGPDPVTASVTLPGAGSMSFVLRDEPFDDVLKIVRI